MKSLIQICRVVVPFCLLAVEARAIPVVSLTADDPINTSSFNSAGNWSDASAPSSANDYVVNSGHTLRSPASGASAAFLGNSLTLGNGTTAGTLSLKSSTNPNTVTIADLRLNNGTVVNNQDVTTATLAGNITVFGGGGSIQANFMTNPPRNVLVTAPISGASSGLLKLIGNASGGPVILDPSSDNTYAGGTSVQGAETQVRKDHALGTGNVSVANGATLTLTLGTTNDYISDGAKLLLATGTPTVNLAFTGTPDTVSALSFDGGTTFVAPGLYGAVGNSSATFTSSRLTGTGLLQVVPEPGTVSLLAMGGLILAASRRRRVSRI